MKAVILAAGKSTRTYPLTLTKPKPLLRIANLSLIEHNLEQLLDLVEEVIIVIGYMGEMIKKQIGSQYNTIKITYIEQEEQLGTGHALLQVEHLVGDRFIVMMGDDLYFRHDIRRCMRYDLAVMVKRVEDYSNFGVFIEKDGKVFDLVEKPQRFVSDIANTAFYVFNKAIFGVLKTMEKSPRGEFELTDALKEMALKEDIFSVEAMAWIPIGYPWNLLVADQIVRDASLEKGKGTVITGEVEDCSVGDDCRIHGYVKKSIIGDNVTIDENSVVEDSIIGDNVHFSGTIKTGNNVKIEVKGGIVQVETMGAVIGDNCTLKGVLVQPGTMVWPGVERDKGQLKGRVEE